MIVESGLGGAKDTNTLNRIYSEKFVLITEKTYLAVFLKKERHCKLTMSGQHLLRVNLGFPVYKGFPYLEQFNKRFVVYAQKQKPFVSFWKTISAIPFVQYKHSF